MELLKYKYITDGKPGYLGMPSFSALLYFTFSFTCSGQVETNLLFV